MPQARKRVLNEPPAVGVRALPVRVVVGGEHIEFASSRQCLPCPINVWKICQKTEQESRMNPTHIQRLRCVWPYAPCRALATILAVITAFQVAASFEKDANLKLVEQKLKFANDVLLAAGNIQTSRSWEEYEKA